MLAGALAALVLTVSLGGTDYPWGSPQIIVLGLIALALLVTFVRVERRAAEPVLPPRLFRERVFTVAGAVGLVAGFAIFGSITFLPLYLQVIQGASPTGSDFNPAADGRAAHHVDRLGPDRQPHRPVQDIPDRRHRDRGRRAVPPVHDVAADVALEASAFMFVLGLGIGLAMQVLILVVQNAVPYKDLGVATSGETLFR